MIVATAGHVDHGKTLLVKALTGVDTDRLPEEKKRGLTIEPGFAYVHLDGGPVLGFVDVPGHERFIRNMLAGVAAIDFALLVVAADDGPMPQTKEHLDILDLLGGGVGAVAVTKTDLVDGDRLAQVMNQTTALLAGTALADAPLFPLSAATGQGVAALDAHLQHAAVCQRTHESRGRFRFSVDRCFILSGIGLVVTGAVVAGRARTDDPLMLSPLGLPVRLRGIRAHDREADEAVAGQRCALNIAGRGLHKDGVRRGDWVLDPELHSPVTRVDVRLRLLSSEATVLKSGTPVHVHLGAAETTGRVHLLVGKTLAPGDEALVQLTFERPLGALGRDRLVLRDKSARRTMAGGRVVDPFAAARGRTRPARLGRLAAMDREAPNAALAGLLGPEARVVNLDDFARAWNLEPGSLDGLLAGHEAVVFTVESQRYAVSQAVWKSAGDAAIARLERWHRQHPADLGASERDLAATVRAPVLRAAVLLALTGDGRLVLSHGAYGLAGHQPVMAGADKVFWDQVRPLLDADDLRPPVLHGLAVILAMEVDEVRRRLAGLARWRLVEQVADNRFFTAGQLRRLEALAVAAAGLAEGGYFSAAGFRDLSGIGRNLTIEVLEHFDRTQVTSRDGEDGRTIHPNFTAMAK